MRTTLVVVKPLGGKWKGIGAARGMAEEADASLCGAGRGLGGGIGQRGVVFGRLEDMDRRLGDAHHITRVKIRARRVKIHVARVAKRRCRGRNSRFWGSNRRCKGNKRRFQGSVRRCRGRQIAMQGQRMAFLGEEFALHGWQTAPCISRTALQGQPNGVSMAADWRCRV